MKKIITFTAILIIVSIFLNPAFGQANRTIKTKDTKGKKVEIPLVEPEKAAVTPDSVSKNANLTLADLLVRLEKMEQRQKSSEKSIGSIKKELKAGKMSILDSMRKLRNESEKSNSGLLLNINNLDDKLKKELASNSKFMLDLEAKADSGSNDAQQALIELETISEDNKKQIWINWIIGVTVICLLCFAVWVWLKKTQMQKTLEDIKNKKDPDHMSFRGSSKNAYGDDVGSTGNQFRTQAHN